MPKRGSLIKRGRLKGKPQRLSAKDWETIFALSYDYPGNKREKSVLNALQGLRAANGEPVLGSTIFKSIDGWMADHIIVNSKMARAGLPYRVYAPQQSWGGDGNKKWAIGRFDSLELSNVETLDDEKLIDDLTRHARYGNNSSPRMKALKKEVLKRLKSQKSNTPVAE